MSLLFPFLPKYIVTRALGRDLGDGDGPEQGLWNDLGTRGSPTEHSLVHRLYMEGFLSAP